MDMLKWHKETADHRHHQTTEDQDKGEEEWKVDGDVNEYQKAS